MTATKDALRRTLRRRRRALNSAERTTAAKAAQRHLQSILPLRRGMRLAIYLAVDGELDTRPVIELARQRGCEIFLPVLRAHFLGKAHAAHRAKLWFVPLKGPMKRNRFGILEPRDATQRIDPRWLDAVLVPLVGFGPHGERLGSGAGFYDQTFAFLRRRRVWRKPHFIGFGYHWQSLDELACVVWDVPLHAVVTDRGTRRFANP